MRELPFEDSSDAIRRCPPNEAKMYIYHDQKVEERYRSGPLKSIEKEIDGMARLIAAIEGETDQETMESLLQSFRDERSRLRDIEDQIQQRNNDI